MTIENVKDYIKANVDVGAGIQLGSINRNKECCIGVYQERSEGNRQNIAIGGLRNTKTADLPVTILIHWGLAPLPALQKREEIYNLFYGKRSISMAGETAAIIEPGRGVIPLGRDKNGIYEYSIELRIIYMKGEK